MRIQNQPIIETDTHLLIRLHQPYWGAWKRYGWPKGVEGFGISNKLIKCAFAKKKKIMVSYPYGRYEIPPIRACRQAKKWNSRYIARTGVELLVVPRIAFKRVIKKEKND